MEPSAKWGPAEQNDRMDYERILNGDCALSLRCSKQNSDASSHEAASSKAPLANKQLSTA